MAVKAEFRIQCDTCPNEFQMTAIMVPDGWQFTDAKGWSIFNQVDVHPSSTRVTCPTCLEKLQPVPEGTH